MSRARMSFSTAADLHQPKRGLPPKYVPDELIGAFNALTSCVRLPSAQRLQVVRAQSAVSLPHPPRPFEADLDFKAHLSIVTRMLCIVLPPFAFWLIAAASQGTVSPETDVQRLFRDLFGPARKNWFQWTCSLAKTLWVFACSAVASIVLSYQIRERQYSHRQHLREQLADADSLFKRACGISVHCKQAFPAQPSADTGTDKTHSKSTSGTGFFRMFTRRRLNSSVDGSSLPISSDTAAAEAAGAAATGAIAAIALYHGFGANLWSWRNVQQELADVAGAVVVSHDMPGFGLTERVGNSKAYTLRTNGDIGRRLCDDVLRGQGAPGDGAESLGYDRNGRTGRYELKQPSERKRPVVLIGHSLGAAGAASSFVQNPEGVDGIVLVAPAIMASPFTVSPKLRSRKIISDDECHRLLEEYDMQPGDSNSASMPDMSPGEQAWQARSLLGGTLQRIKCLLIPCVFWLIRPFAYVVLRGLVRMKQFWERGLKSCYFDTAKLSEQMVYYYRLPQLMAGWESGILHFLQARLMADEPWKSQYASPPATQPSPGKYVTKGDSLLSRFEQCVKDTGVPVLIIHGEQDQLVPVGNSCRLSAVLQAPLIKISGCGHTPAEELPDTFVTEVSRFMNESVWNTAVPSAAV